MYVRETKTLRGGALLVGITCGGTQAKHSDLLFVLLNDDRLVYSTEQEHRKRNTVFRNIWMAVIELHYPERLHLLRPRKCCSEAAINDDGASF